jgi:hypothetical protein
MAKWKISIILLFISFSFASTVYAQEGAPEGASNAVQIGSLQISLWPEYDQPNMLVIYHLTLSADTELPAQLSIHIPATAGRPNAVAVRDPNGGLVNLEYEINSDGVWSTIQMVASFPELQIEYYDPGLQIDGTQRNFSFEWYGQYAVAQSTVEVQQPLDTTDISLSPGPVRSETAADGLSYIIKEVGALSKGQNFKIELSYNKSSQALTISQLPVQPSAPLTTEPGWQDRMAVSLPWILGVAGVLLIAGGALWYWQTGRQPRANTTKRGRASQKTTEYTNDPVDEQVVYCHQCGKRASAGDRFCRSCGTRLRVE